LRLDSLIFLPQSVQAVLKWNGLSHISLYASRWALNQIIKLTFWESATILLWETMYDHDTNLERYIQEHVASNVLPVGSPIGTTQPNNPPSAEKRREPRFVTNNPAFIHSLNPLTLDLTPAQVLDVSRQGLKLRIGRLILTGSEIQVKLRDLFVLGEIRYCVHQVGSFFLAGILVEDVLRLPHVN
jgi:hypothetical protein